MHQNNRELAMIPVGPGPDVNQAMEQAKTPVEGLSDVPQDLDSMISQTELQTYVEQAEVCRVHHRLRQSITERLERGVPVELGELKAEIEPEDVTHWSSGQLTELLGPEKTAEIWNQLQPIRYRRLLILRAGRDIAWKAHRLAHPRLETIPPPCASTTAPPNTPATAPSGPLPTAPPSTSANTPPATSITAAPGALGTAPPGKPNTPPGVSANTLPSTSVTVPSGMLATAPSAAPNTPPATPPTTFNTPPRTLATAPSVVPDTDTSTNRPGAGDCHNSQTQRESRTATAEHRALPRRP